MPEITNDEKEIIEQKLEYIGLDLENVDRKSVVQGKSVDLGGRRIIKKKREKTKQQKDN